MVLSLLKMGVHFLYFLQESAIEIFCCCVLPKIPILVENLDFRVTFFFERFLIRQKVLRVICQILGNLSERNFARNTWILILIIFSRYLAGR